MPKVLAVEMGFALLDDPNVWVPVQEAEGLPDADNMRGRALAIVGAERRRQPSAAEGRMPEFWTYVDLRVAPFEDRANWVPVHTIYTHMGAEELLRDAERRGVVPVANFIATVEADGSYEAMYYTKDELDELPPEACVQRAFVGHSDDSDDSDDSA